jgi:hypothetical protein
MPKNRPAVPEEEEVEKIIPSDDVLCTLGETSTYLREHPRSTRRRVARGELPVIVLPGSRKLLFDPPTVREFVRRNSNGTNGK